MHGVSEQNSKVQLATPSCATSIQEELLHAQQVPSKAEHALVTDSEAFTDGANVKTPKNSASTAAKALNVLRMTSSLDFQGRCRSTIRSRCDQWPAIRH